MTRSIYTFAIFMFKFRLMCVGVTYVFITHLLHTL